MDAPKDHAPSGACAVESVRSPRAPRRHATYITVTSGKGGVGKSNVAVNLAVRLAQMDRRITEISPEAMEVLTAYDWPGNVRELEKAIEHAVLVSRSPAIAAADLPEAVTAGGAADTPRVNACDAGTLAIPALADGWTPTHLEDVMRQCERQILRAALDANDWNRSQTARQLNINRATLYKKVRAYRLDEPDAA